MLDRTDACLPVIIETNNDMICADFGSMKVLEMFRFAL
jgi:hypothetical protein